MKRRDGTSQLKGVCWDKHRGKWKATCQLKFLGYHATEEAAARAVAKYAKAERCRLTRYNTR